MPNTSTTTTQPPTTPSISGFERASTPAMGPDNTAGASVACTEPSPRASASKLVAGEPAASRQTPYSNKDTRIITPQSPLYLSDTPALTVSSFPPSSPECLRDPSHQATQHGPADTSYATDDDTGIEPSDDDASIYPRRVMADPDTLMAAEVLMRLSGRNNVNKPSRTSAFKILMPAFSTPTNVPLREVQRSNPPLPHPALATSSLVTTQEPYASISITPTSVSSLLIASPFAPSPRTLSVSSKNDQPSKMSLASFNIETNTQPVVEETAVVVLAPLPPTETSQSTQQVTKPTTGVEGPTITSRSHSRKRRRDPSPTAGNPLKIPKTVKSKNISSSTKKFTNTFKDTAAKSSRAAKKDPSLSPKSNAASEGLIGHLITALSLDGRSSLPFSKIVERVLESQPHLLDERPAAEWSELVKKTLNYSRNAMFGRAERKGLKVCPKSQIPWAAVE